MNIIPSDKELEFPHILQVEASAGSGKTFLLSQRFIQFLLSNEIPRSNLSNILAITFTNESTLDMKRRVLNMLKNAAFGDQETIRHISQLVSGPPENIKNLALEKVDYIVSHFDDLHIMTIDSFAYLLVQAAHYELGLSPQSQVDTDEKPFLETAMDRLILHAQKDMQAWDLLNQFIIHYLDFEGKGAWWPRSGLLRQLSLLLDKEKNHGLEFNARKKVNTIKLRELIYKRTKKLLENLEKYQIKPKKNHQKALEEVAAGSDLLKCLKKTAWKKESLEQLLYKNQSCPQDLGPRWRQIKKLCNSFSVTYAQEKNIPYLRLFSPWKEELDLLKDRAKVLFIADINGFAKKMHAESLLPEVFFRLGERIYHIFMDEFQDTSTLQWENLYPLFENALSQGGSLFFVGDKKQLLYRFRGSDIQVSDHGPKSLENIVAKNFNILYLPYNWRSREEIVRFVARCFHRDNLKRLVDEKDFKDKSRILNVFSHVKQRIPESCSKEMEGGFVRIETLIEDNPASEAKKEAWFRTVKLLKDDLLKRFSPEDIIILVRKNDDLEELTQVLLHNKIPVISERQQDIRENPAIKEFVSLLTFLENPEDNLAFSTAICGSLLEKFWKTCSQRKKPWEWLERRISPNEIFYQSFKKDFPEFWAQVFEQPFQLIGQVPSYELAAHLLKKLGIREEQPELWPAFGKFLEILHEKQPLTGGDISSFLDWVPDAPLEFFTPKGLRSIDAVRVMTIHKAKGLENKVAIIPFACIESKRENLFVKEKNGRLHLYHIKKPLNELAPLLNELYQEEVELSLLDELNVLYVAFTRAKEEMYIFIPKKIQRSNNELLTLLRPIMGEKDSICLGSSVSAPKKEKITAPPISILATEELSTSKDEKLPTKGKASPSIPSFRRRKKMELGTLVHEMLSQITTSFSCPKTPKEIIKILENYRPIRNMEKIQDELILKIANTICLPKAQSLFWTKPSALIHTEKEVSDGDGNLFRVDRLVISGETAQVCEFKMGGRKEEDIKQIQLYCHLLKSIYKDHLFSGIILYIEDEREETVFCGELVEP